MTPLEDFFRKPVKGQAQVSPQGRLLAWTARDSNGVSNLWIKDQETDSESQITFFSDRDACFLYFFSEDDKYLLYLREFNYAKEIYHLYTLDLEVQADNIWSTNRDLIVDEDVTVAVGFVGGVQIWTPPETPREIFLSTGKGKLFWDISRLNLDTGERCVIASNPISTWFGILGIAGSFLWYSFVRFFSFGMLKPAPPSVPVIQWFLDRTKGYKVRGRVELSAFPLSLCLSVKSNGVWTTLQRIPFPELNMQLVGSSGASGTLRMDFSTELSGKESVTVHTCGLADTTVYSKFVKRDDQWHQTEFVGGVHPRGDIEGFMVHPQTGKMQALIHHVERRSVTVIDNTIQADLDLFREKFDDLDVIVTSRSNDDRVWLLYVSGDICAASYYIYVRPTKQISFLFSTRPELASVTLAAMIPVDIPTRDGQTILGYLSTPPAFKATANPTRSLVVE